MNEGDHELQRAFEHGAQYAAEQIAQRQAEAASASLQQTRDALKRANEEQEHMLRERIEALQLREYRAPVKPLSCKEERETALACYRGARVANAKPGETALACERVATELDRCAILVREAAMTKIVANALQ